MSCYFTTDRFNIVVSAEKKDAAVKYLSEENIYDFGHHPMKVYVEDLGNGLFELTPEWNPFSGDWSNSGPYEEIAGFLETYCEPGSHISQRCDDYFEYSAYWLDDERKVHDAWEGFVNPFDEMLDKLCERKEVK